MSKYQKALVVDASFTARSVISTERAFVIFYKGNAEVMNPPSVTGDTARVSPVPKNILENA